MIRNSSDEEDDKEIQYVDYSLKDNVSGGEARDFKVILIICCNFLWVTNFKTYYYYLLFACKTFNFINLFYYKLSRSFMVYYEFIFVLLLIYL